MTHFSIVTRGALVGDRKCRKHDVPDPEVWQQGAARSKAEERLAAECGHLLHRDCCRRGSDRGTSDDNRFPSRGSYTQPPIPTLQPSFDDSMESPKIARAEREDAHRR